MNNSLLLSKNGKNFNQYYLSFAVVNLEENKFLGSDIFIDFEDNLFGNNENDPRVKANSLISEKNEGIHFESNTLFEYTINFSIYWFSH